MAVGAPACVVRYGAAGGFDLGLEAGDFGSDHPHRDDLDRFRWCDTGTIEHATDRSEYDAGSASDCQEGYFSHGEPLCT